VVAFDADGTLWADDAGIAFFEDALRRVVLLPENLVRGRRAWNAYHAGDMPTQVFYRTRCECFGRLAPAEVQARAEAFFAEHFERRIFPEMAALV